MSEHWKSTPRYWCKHCACYVRDTKLERQNHEATARHQGNLKRFLRELHRGHEREEQEKERARQEVARVSGVVAGPSSSSSQSGGAASSLRSSGARNDGRAVPGEAELKRQREQLAEMGVAIPTEFRSEMAIPGEWQVTSTRVLREPKEGEESSKEARAMGVRKRDATEDEKEEEDAIRGLFKKPRKWGRDSKSMPQDEDTELDALLSGGMLKRIGSDEGGAVKHEEPPGGVKEEAIKNEVKVEEGEAIKSEPDDAAQGLSAPIAADEGHKSEESADAAAPVVFKKRKPKGIRQK